MTIIKNGSVTSPRGFRATGVAAGIKTKAGAKDLAIIFSDVPASAAGVFTTNKVKAAPVLVSQQHLQDGKVQAIIVNGGNSANACTGEDGLKNARRMVEATGAALGVSVEDVLVASTGVIGVPLPIDKIEMGIPTAVSRLSPDGGHDAAEAIMTTDTFPKKLAVEIPVSKGTIRIGGIAKGAGMIAPNMATMLAFITTDAEVEPTLLQRLLKDCVERSFNMITVDGDTSTNDTVFLLANGQSGTGKLSDPDIELFKQGLDYITLELAKMIARDGEGATKFVTVKVTGARDVADAKRVGMSVANSNLVKTALFGADPNWGRITCAVGYSGAEVDPDRLTVSIGEIVLMESGMPTSFDKDAAHAYLKGKDITISVDLGLGGEEAEVYTCDFSYDYVKINAEYTT